MKYTTSRLNALHTILMFMLGRKPTHVEMIVTYRILFGRLYG
jgi:hypothetical protein